MENYSFLGAISVRRAEPFGDLFSTFSRHRFFDAFWSPLGSLLAPFWLPLAHFWLPLAHFWLPLAHFWLPLAPFWLTFGVPWLTFAISCPHFSFFLEFSTKISCKIVVLNNFHCKSHSRSIKSYFPEARRTHPNRKYILSFITHPQGPGAEHLPLAT